MTNKEKVLFAVNVLKGEYPDPKCMLLHSTPLELLIAVRLSAQCTDKRVNMITPAMFERYKTAEDYANADVSDIENYIRSCGLYKTKARDIVNMCKRLCSDFNGEVPDNMKALTSLPGVGRKTANLILGDIYNQPAVVVDTHCIRITARLGLHSTKDAHKIENILRELLPPEESNSFCHRIVLHGRAVCKAQKPLCDKCCLKSVCTYKT